MASASNATPVVSDGVLPGGKDGARFHGTRFEWVSSSPPPATVSELERRFPDVIQVPIQELELESSDWGAKAIIARSLSRWIPPEAIVRELRRAGAGGEIESISLAHRHYLFRFSDPEAKLMALGNPWIVNGQVIAVEDWKPEFIPSDTSLSSALLWIRLPSLPMEFWTESILSSILAAAGRFVFLDSATKERKRGGFARACVQVDLGKPLRPGVRVRGLGNPFWQSFVYEHVEGLCSSCGALHSSAGCPSAPASSPASPVPLYGPWMSAIRRRRTPQPEVRELEKKSPKASSSSSPCTAEGWSAPKKTARRKPGVNSDISRKEASASVLSEGSGKAMAVSFHGAQASGEGLQKVACQTLFSVPVLAESSGEPAAALKFHSIPTSVNPFALLGSDKAVGRPKSRKEANTGPLKRARPMDPISSRVSSRVLKGKGKSSEAGSGEALVVQEPNSLAFAVSAEDSRLPVPEHHSHDSVVSLLKTAMQEAGDGVAMDSQGPSILMDNTSIDVSPDLEMRGDREDPPQSK